MGRRCTYSNGTPNQLTRVLQSSASNGGGIAVSSSGRRHIVSAGGPAGAGTALVHLWSETGTTWEQEFVDFDTLRPALAVDIDGNPAIAYWKASATELWLARRRDDGTWTKSLVATTPTNHWSLSIRLAFDADGHPHVLYFNEATADVVLASGTPLADVTAGRLVVSKSGTGSGTVTSSSLGIDCGIDCAEQYAPGTTIVLTATPDPGFTFGGWTGACTNAGSCAVTLTNAASVGAIFHAPRPGTTITVDASCTLEQAIQAANNNTAIGGCAAGTGADTIVLPVGVVTLTQPFAGNPAFDSNGTGLPHITSEITIAGQGPGSTIVYRAEGSPSFRFFRVRPPSGHLTIRDLLLRGGHSGNAPGGAILDESITTIDNVYFDLNEASHEGGAVYGNGKTTIRASQFTNNKSVGWGGAARLAAGTVERTTFSNNFTTFTGGALYLGSGAVTESVFAANRVNNDGGALSAGPGPVTAARLTMIGNTAANGGAIVPGTGTFTLIDSLLKSNQATGHGGAIMTIATAGPKLNVVGSTFQQNIAGNNGGAIHIVSPATLRNTTLYANTAAGNGGGLYVNGNTDLQNVTITQNHAANFGGGLMYWSTASLSMGNTILAGNLPATGYLDCYAPGTPIVSRGFNLLGNNIGCLFAATTGDQVGTSAAPILPLLGALGDNGGPTPTMVPALNSPVVDAGNPVEPGSVPEACEVTDQRGVLRPQRNACDIGAVERRNQPPIGGLLSITTDEDQPVELAIAVTDPEGDQVTLNVVSGPSHGVVSGAPVNLTYTPAADYHGPDEIGIGATDEYGGRTTIVLQVTVEPVNDPPQASDDEAAVTAQGSSTIDVLANDFDRDGDALAVTRIVTPPQYGTAAIESGRIHYTAVVPIATASDSLTYEIADAEGRTAMAAVHMSLLPANRPPSSNLADLQVFEGAAAFFQLILADADGHQIQAAIEGLPPGLAASIHAPGEHGVPQPHVIIAGTPGPGSAGQYPASLRLNDGFLEVIQPFVIIVRAPNRPPLAADDVVTVPQAPHLRIPVTANDTDPDGDALTVVSVTAPSHGLADISENTIEYHATTQGWFADTFFYTVADALGAESTAKVVVRMLSSDSNLTVAISPPSLVVGVMQAFGLDLVVTNQGAIPVSGATLTVDVPEHLGDAGWLSGPVPSRQVEIPVAALAGGESRSFNLPLGATTVTGFFTVGARVAALEGDDPAEDTDATSVVAVQPDFCFAPLAGLRGRWRAEGSAASDIAVRLVVEDAGYASSRRGQAFQFDGSLHQLVNANLHTSPAAAFTVSSWAQLAPNASTLAPVVSGGSGVPSSGASTWYWLGFDGAVPTFALYDQGVRVANIRAAAPIAAGTWVHLTASYDGSTARLYVDGVEAASDVVAVVWQGSESLTFGAALAGEFQAEPSWYSGLVDDVAHHDRVLTAVEVARMVHGDADGCVVPTAVSLEVALSVGRSPLPVLSTATFTATVTNTSDGFLEDVELAYALDPQAQYIDAQPASEAVDPDFPLAPRRWLIGPLLRGESRTVTLRAHAPAVDGVFVNQATARDLQTPGVTAEGTLSYVVAPEACFAPDFDPETCVINQRPVLEDPGPQQFRVDEAVLLQLTASDADSEDVLTFSATGLPAGVTIDTATGLISGAVSPGGSGTRTVVVTVSDGRLAASQSFEWRTLHRLRVMLGRGSRWSVNGEECDATAAAATCDWHLAHQTPVAITRQTVPSLAGLTPWLEEDGERRSEQLLASGFAITASRTFRFDLMAIFTVTSAGFPEGSSFSLEASVPIAHTSAEWRDANLNGLFTNLDSVFAGNTPRDVLACYPPGGDPACVGRAPLDSAANLVAPDTVEAFFDRFSGGCGGSTCAVSLEGPLTNVTVHYRPRPWPLTVQAGPSAIVSITDLTRGSEFTCDGGAIGADCAIDIPWGNRVRMMPVTPGWSHWRWNQQLATPDDRPAEFPMNGARSVSVHLRSGITATLQGRSWAEGVAYPIRVFEVFGSGESSQLSCSPGDDSITCVGTTQAFRTFEVIATDATDVRGWSGACSAPASTCTFVTDQPVMTFVALVDPLPVVASPLQDVAVTEGASPVVIDLRAVFVDPEADALTFSISGAPDPQLVGVAINNATGQLTLSFVAGATGTTSVSVTASDPNDGTAADMFDVTVSRAPNTPQGEDVVVKPDAPSSSVPVTLTFDRVTATGVTTAVDLPVAPPPPAGFRNLAPPVTVDISTTAAFDGAVQICLTYVSGANVALFHFEGGVWVNVTTTRQAQTVCGMTTSLSPFALFEIANRPPTAEAGPDVHTTATSSRGADIVLNGSASSDPDGDVLTYQWSSPVASGSGAKVSLTLPIGEHRVTLVVTDRHGASASDTVVVTVSDVIEPGDMSGLGLVRQEGRTYHFEFRVRETDRRGERGRFRLTVDHPKTTVLDGRGRPKQVKSEDDRFVAREIDFIAFADDPTIRPGRRRKPQIDSVVFSGTGEWNGEDGYRFEVQAVDEGEPGRHREAVSITIVDPAGLEVARVSGDLSGGNVQSRRIRH